MPFNRENWMGVLNDYDGYLPVEIEAVPEGTVLPPRNVLVQLINTDPKYFWVTSFFETALLRAVWYPTTIGTISWLAKQVIRTALDRTFRPPGEPALLAARLRRARRQLAAVRRPSAASPTW